MNKCNELIMGPMGSHVGRCELERDHDGPCKINGLTEQDMVDRLNDWIADGKTQDRST